MATDTRRDEWRESEESGCWSCSIGRRGLRIRLFQKRREGPYYRSVWVAADEKPDVRSLQTKDKDVARQLGDRLLLQLTQDSAPCLPQQVSLAQLWRRYRAECEDYLDNSEKSRRDAETRAAMLIGHFGSRCDVTRLTQDDVRKYERVRAKGGIEYVLDDACRLAKQRTPASRMRQSNNKKRELTEAQQRALAKAPASFVSRRTRARSAEADLVLLDAMLTWATTVWVEGGERWLQANSLAGIRRRPEKNPKRPIATWDRFMATRAAMQRLAQRELETHRELERMKGESLPLPESWWRWIKLELALVLAEATGRRLGAIRQLRWEHVNFEAAEITWVADTDKKGVEWIVPIPQALLDELRNFRKTLGAISGWVFPGERKPDQPMDRHLFDKWLAVAEHEAKLSKLRGGLWHPYRRKWAMERKHLPVTDVAAVGGWKDIETLLKCYSQPDRQTMLDVIGESAKLRDGGAGARVPALSRETKARIMSGG